MMQKLSSVKSDSVKSVFCDNLMRYKSIWILYTLLSFLLLPFSVILGYISTGNTHVATELFFHALTFMMSVILPLILFNYVNHKQAIDVFHSLPVKRKNLYWGNYLFGLTVLLVPYIIFIAASVIIRGALSGDYSLEVDYFVLTAGITAFYSTMIFIITNCGTIFESVTYFGIMHAGYPLLVLAFFEFIDYITYGYASFTLSGLQDWLFKFAPVIQIFNINSNWNEYNFTNLIILIGISVVFAVSGSILYKKRKSEAAGQSFAFMPLFYIGSLLVSFTVAVGFVLLFEAKGIYSYVFGVVFGLICYIILDTIRNRSIKNILTTLKVGISMSAVIVLLFVTCNVTHTFGYETYIPVTEKVKSVSVNWSAPGSLQNVALSAEVELFDQQSIENTVKFHKSIVANIQSLEGTDRYYNQRLEKHSLSGYEAYAFDDNTFAPSDYDFDNIKITYTLKNGRKVSRQYNAPFVLTKPLLEIAKSDAYEEAFASNVNNYVWEELSVMQLFFNEATFKLSSSNSKLLTEAIAKDLAKEKVNFNVTSEEIPAFDISLRKGFARDYKSVTLSVYPDTETYKFLKENGFMPSDVSYYNNQCECSYVEKETLSELVGFDNSPRAFFCAGTSSYRGEWMASKYPEEDMNYYPYKFYNLPFETVEKLMTMVTPHYYSETPSDVLAIDGMTYIVLPEYEKEVKALVENGEPYVPENIKETVEIELAETTHFG